MDVIKLKSFIAVARLGNFRKASEELFFTQPAISAQIRELENYYNTSLFERLSGGRIRLTESGGRLLEYAEDIVKKFEESKYSVQNAQDSSKGRIRIGTSILPGIYYLPGRIAEFRDIYPDISFDISLNYSSDIEKLVLDGSIHLGIIGTPKDFVFDSSLSTANVFRDRIIACIYEGHNLWEKKSVKLEELGKCGLILQPKNTYTRKILERKMKEAKVSFSVAYEIGNTEMIKKMVEKKLGISVLCSSMVPAMSDCSRLKAVEIEDLDSYRNISIVFRKDVNLSLQIKAFSDFLVSHPIKNGEGL